MGHENHLLGAIEAGGTKWVCAVGTGEDGILEETVVATGSPSKTLVEVFAAFDAWQKEYGPLTAMGIGTFGPVVVDRESDAYGTILNSPKRAWRGFDFVAAMEEHLGQGFPVALDTDVNAAVLAEREAFAAPPGSLVYLTVGTGIGGGVIVDGKIGHGRMHPEMGHLLVPELAGEPRPGFSSCEFHASCIEGKASGTAMRERWGMKAEELPEGHDGWELEAEYLASLAVSLTAAFSPDCLVFGGGVMSHEPLLPMIREHFSRLAGAYWDLPPMSDYLCKSALQNRAGLQGALALAAGLSQGG